MQEDNILLILGRLEGKIDAFKDSKASQDARMDKQDERIDKVESYLQQLFWKVAAISGAIASGASYLTHGVNH